MTHYRERIVALVAGPNMSPNLETFLYNFGRMLHETYEFHLLIGNHDLPNRLEPFYKAFQFPTHNLDPGGFRFAWSACRGYLKEVRPDLLMNAVQPGLALAASINGDRFGISTAVRMSGSLAEGYLGRSYIERAKNWVLHYKMNLLACQRADNVITLGEYSYRHLVNKLATPEKIHVLPQPFNPKPFSEPHTCSQPRIKERLGLSPNKKIILFVGRMSLYKGVDKLVSVIKHTLRASQRYQFCLIGEGPYGPIIDSFPDRHVQRVKHIEQEDIIDYYRASDLFVFPSRTEGLPNVILEALAARLPIIASPVGEIPAYVSHTSENTEDYVEHILQGDWTPDPLPVWFDYETQRTAYLNFFAQAMER